MNRSRRNPLVLGLIAAVAMLLLGGAVALAHGKEDPEDVDIKITHEGKGVIRIVTVDEDGNRHEETIEFDSDSPRAFLGVSVERTRDGGARVEEVIEDSAAALVGLQEGDVIVGFGGREIESPSDLTRQVLQSQPGDQVELEVLRDGQRLSLTAELGERDWFSGFSFGRGFSPRPKLGVQLIHPTPELREHYGAPRDAGVLVGKVLPRMPAADAGVLVGDLIVAADGNEVDDAGDLIRALRRKSGETIELELIRDGRSMTLEVFIPEQDKEEELPSGPRPAHAQPALKS